MRFDNCQLKARLLWGRSPQKSSVFSKIIFKKTKKIKNRRFFGFFIKTRKAKFYTIIMKNAQKKNITIRFFCRFALSEPPIRSLFLINFHSIIYTISYCTVLTKIKQTQIFCLIFTFFVIEYRNMKQYISILSILACVFGANCVRASDCVDEDCNLDETVVMTESEYATDTDVLAPAEYDENVWFEQSNDTCDVIVDDSVAFDYNCPFETKTECEIWAKKPLYSTAVTPRSPHLNYVKLDGILATLTFNGEISANDELAKPLLNRYLALMRASRACCSEGIIYKLRQDGAKDKKVYNFLTDDANMYAVGSRCMVMDDSEIGDSYSYGVTGEIVMDVRNSCICKNRQWIDSLLEPFFDLYQLAPDFEYMPFYYTYMDGLQREVTVSVNSDVQSVMEMLQYCPD